MCNAYIVQQTQKRSNANDEVLHVCFTYVFKGHLARAITSTPNGLFLRSWTSFCVRMCVCVFFPHKYYNGNDQCELLMNAMTNLTILPSILSPYFPRLGGRKRRNGLNEVNLSWQSSRLLFRQLLEFVIRACKFCLSKQMSHTYRHEHTKTYGLESC